MTSLQIRYFLEVARCGSFSKAAERLFAMQPAVSKKIQLMEQELNVELFHRSYRKATLTPAGELYYQLFSKFEREFENVAMTVSQMQRGISSKLSVIAVEGLEITKYSEVLQKLHWEHPMLSVSMDRKSPSEMLDDLLSGNADVVIAFDHLVDGADGISTMVLYESKCSLFFSTNHVLSQEQIENIDLKAFKNETFFWPRGWHSATPGTLRLNEEIRQCLGFVPTHEEHLSSIYAVQSALSCGIGVAVMADEATQNYNLKEINRIPLDIPSNVVAAWRKDNRNQFLRLLLEGFRKCREE